MIKISPSTATANFFNFLLTLLDVISAGSSLTPLQKGKHALPLATKHGEFY